MTVSKEDKRQERSPKRRQRARALSPAKSKRTKAGSSGARGRQDGRGSAKAKAEAVAVTVVGLGASAGGIEALCSFFESMPADSGLAFVVVLHLDPTHESGLAPLLGHRTAMPVVEITDGLPIEANRVHVIVPNASLTLRNDRLRLSEPRQPRGHRHPVDVFFESLAEDRRERAIAIILSGTGSNGTNGLRAIKANGGLTLVQDPGTARFDGMPRSAIAAGAPDRVLAPEKMPEFLMRYTRHDYLAAPSNGEISGPDGRLMLEVVLPALRARSGHDFQGYKQNTLTRRIHRRMGLSGVAASADYAELLRTNAAEVKALVQDLLISVTAFFRDPGAWKTLDKMVLAPLIAARSEQEQIRLWVPACATGEEAYSLAMLAVEHAEAAKKPVNLKIFATDSLEGNLNQARAGVYPQSALAAVPQERLSRFFDQVDHSYQVKQELRELVMFAPQNLLRDPPFSHLDLITCRNLLIYLEPEVQKRVLALFHFALREGGHLFLGNAETIGRNDDLFDIVSKKWRIFKRIGPTRHDLVSFPLLGTHPRAQPLPDPVLSDLQPPLRMAEMARRALLERYAPASVLIDQKGRILYFHGATGDFLEQPSGEPTRDLLTMAREGLRSRLRAAMREATDKHRSVTFSVRVRQDKRLQPVSVTIEPLAAAQPDGDRLLVCFAPAAGSREVARIVGPDDNHGDLGTDSGSRRVLEEELRTIRAELQVTVEQMESANEELKAANEEVTSMNEELQSTVEELETSKEEMQSYNEELHTVNGQLQHKIQELNEVTSDLENLLTGTEIATIFLDKTLRIRWFSPASTALIDLVPSDIGRPLAHFAPKFADANLQRDAEAVLDKLTPSEAEVRSDSGVWYLRRLLPYRTQGKRIAGAVLIFVDITARKAAADVINEQRLYAQAIVETIRQPLLVLDAGLRIRSANRAFYAQFQVTSGETKDHLIYELGNGQWNIPRLRTLLEKILSHDQHVEDFIVEHEFESIGSRTMLLNARKLPRDGERADLVLLAIEDITERSAAEAHRDILIGELSHRVKNVLATIQSVAAQSLLQSESLDDFQTAFDGRLQAFARAHDLLVEEGWSGASVEQLVRQTLQPYEVIGRKRIVAHGPSVRLQPQAGVALIMILHELATNASKYGALSVPEGRVEVRWRREGGRGRPHIRLNWRESGGPRVAVPERRGFGTSLIERSTEYELHGKASLQFRDEGLSCEMTFPWAPPPPNLNQAREEP